MNAALFVATLLIVGCTLLPLSRHEAWWVRSMDFPRFQLFILAGLLLAAHALWLDRSQPMLWLMPLATLACLVYQAWWIVPYTRLYRREVRDAKPDASNTLRVMSSNVLMSNRNVDALIDLVRQHRPDVLVTLETDAWWQTQLLAIEPDYPHRIACPLDNRYGMHVYSRRPFESQHTDFLIEADIPSIHVTLHLDSGQPVRMHFMHPAPPSPTENEESSERDAELLMVARRIEKCDVPTIVAGDLNDVAWSTTTRLFRKISGLLDPRVGRGMYNTFHAEHIALRWPLDHLFHSEHFTLARLERLPAIGSDHFPILVELVCEGCAVKEQHGLEADAEDEALAERKIATPHTPL